MQNSRQLLWAFAGVLGFAIGSGAPALGAADAPLDPNLFTSLGFLPAANNYTFNTGNGLTTPWLTLDNSLVINGVISYGVAVFDFSSIAIPSGSTMTYDHIAGAGSLPLALLSRASVQVNGTVNISGYRLLAGPAGGGGGANSTLPAAGGGPGGGPPLQAGGGYGGQGGAGIGSSTGGATYGDATHVFQGGSGGAGHGGFLADGGGGGGAIEISAVGDITIGSTGAIHSDGGVGETGFGLGGGGGSGGGIFLATPGQISLAGAISANGGQGGSLMPPAEADAGGGGGGGRVLLETSNYLNPNNLGTLVAVGGSGGANPSTFVPGSPGGDGTVVIADYVPAVPEPGIAFMLTATGIALLCRRRRN